MDWVNMGGGKKTKNKKPGRNQQMPVDYAALPRELPNTKKQKAKDSRGAKLHEDTVSDITLPSAQIDTRIDVVESSKQWDDTPSDQHIAQQDQSADMKIQGHSSSDSSYQWPNQQSDSDKQTRKNQQYNKLESRKDDARSSKFSSKQGHHNARNHPQNTSFSNNRGLENPQPRSDEALSGFNRNTRPDYQNRSMDNSRDFQRHKNDTIHNTSSDTARTRDNVGNNKSWGDNNNMADASKKHEYGVKQKNTSWQGSSSKWSHEEASSSSRQSHSRSRDNSSEDRSNKRITLYPTDSDTFRQPYSKSKSNEIRSDKKTFDTSKQHEYFVKHDNNSSNYDFLCYQKFLEEYRNSVKVNEIQSDLFELSEEYALAHCVAEDMAMGSGIAVRFRREFKSVEELYAQRQRQGGLAILQHKGRYIYYLVTKRRSLGKPTLHTLLDSLLKLNKHIIDNSVKKLAMPRIGCGLDRLEWSDVKPMLEFVFQQTDVEITVCNFQQPEYDEADYVQSSQLKLRKCRVTNVHYPLSKIEAGTIVIYLGYEDGFVSPQIKTLDEKFMFLDDYKNGKRIVGDIIQSYKFYKEYMLCAFIIYRSRQDDFDFKSFQKCIVTLNKLNGKKDNQYGYVGIEAFLDEDDLIMDKIVTLLRYDLRNVEVYVCWPGELEKYSPHS